MENTCKLVDLIDHEGVLVKDFDFKNIENNTLFCGIALGVGDRQVEVGSEYMALLEDLRENKTHTRKLTLLDTLTNIKPWNNDRQLQKEGVFTYETNGFDRIYTQSDNFDSLYIRGIQVNRPCRNIRASRYILA